jgi:hypothetical protein
MSSINEEIQELKLRMLELEQNQKEKEKNDFDNRKTSIEYNFKFINDGLTSEKHYIDQYWDKYWKKYLFQKKEPVKSIVRFGEDTKILYLEATYNILQILDNRLSKLESKCI